jgi:hypothetical protein
MRKAVLGVLAVITTVAVGGCAFDGTPSIKQTREIGPVALTFSVCATPSTGPTSPSGSCGSVPPDYDTDATAPSQIFVGFEVPIGTSVPAAFKSSGIGPGYVGPQLTLTGSHWYSTGLEELLPARSGYKWAGYVSPWADNYSDSSGPQNFTATVDFGLPPGKNGKPFAGPFTYEAVVGGQQYFAGSMGAPAKPSDNVPKCSEGSSTDQGLDESTYFFNCDEQSYPASGFVSLNIANAALLPGKETSASRKSTANTHFTFDYTGTALGNAFKFSATTTLHGTKIKLSPATFKPTGTSSKQVTVKFKVPAGARSGTYKVTLTAKLANGQTRTATDELKVH